jgi:hypothetical protein
LKRKIYILVVSFIMIAVMSNIHCVLVMDKKVIAEPSLQEQIRIFSKYVKGITEIDTTQVKADGLFLYKIDCDDKYDSNNVLHFLPMGRYSEAFYLKSFSCGGCPTGYFDKRANSDTLVCTFNISDSCTTKCSPYHIFVEGNFENYQFIKKLEIVTKNQSTDTIESILKNTYNWVPHEPGKQRPRGNLEE